MCIGSNDYPQGMATSNPWDMLGQIGFPLAQHLLEEMLGFNANLEQMTPGLHKLVLAGPSTWRNMHSVEEVGRFEGIKEKGRMF